MGKSKSGRSTMVVNNDGTITLIGGRNDRERLDHMVRKGLIESTPPSTSRPTTQPSKR